MNEYISPLPANISLSLFEMKITKKTVVLFPVCMNCCNMNENEK